MPHTHVKINLFCRLSGMLTILLLIVMMISGCQDEPVILTKTVQITGDRFVCKNCDKFGTLIEMDGNLLAIAEASVLFLFERIDGQWKLVQEINFHVAGSSSSIMEVVLLPSLLVVGLVEFDGKGSVALFEKAGTGQWTKFQDLAADLHQDRFGSSINVLDDRMLIGAPAPYMENDPISPNKDIGRVYVYKLENTVWVFEAELPSTSPQADDLFGYHVCLVGNYALASDNWDSVQVFKRTGNEWSFDRFLNLRGASAIERWANEIMIYNGDLTALMLDETSGEFIERTTDLMENIYVFEFSDGIEMYNGSVLFSALSRCLLFQLNGNNWSFVQDFPPTVDMARGLALSDQFVAISENNNSVNLYPR